MTYASPAPAPPLTLATKGVAALGTSGRGGLEPIANTFFDGRLTVYAPIDVTLGSQLLNPYVGNIAGLMISTSNEGAGAARFLELRPLAAGARQPDRSAAAGEELCRPHPRRQPDQRLHCPRPIPVA